MSNTDVPNAYIKDGNAIYEKSFSIIRSEANLTRFTKDEERVVVRMIHGCGMVDLADLIRMSPDFTKTARAAIEDNCTIFCDSKMVASGITMARMEYKNEVVCTLQASGIAELAKRRRTTRSAAALDFWGKKLEGSIVAIGNAPTALFRLIEIIGETGIKPAAIIGLPVGFVGAAESKDALIKFSKIPYLTVKGRRGGSAMTASAINAIITSKEIV
ncbi:MAG: precorrin-8X methylmutase [Coxiella sp. RIFCSPHIGHO2_12_FULL_44_14]|nr:MAG: precorrin-8X methylmutase [Coxiella sp. RIFCSPHIGHO2_12_FULL_44_14]